MTPSGSKDGDEEESPDTDDDIKEVVDVSQKIQQLKAEWTQIDKTRKKERKGVKELEDIIVGLEVKLKFLEVFLFLFYPCTK